LGLLLDALKQHAPACRSQQQQAAGLLGHGHDSSASLASSGKGPVAGAVALLCLLGSFVRCFQVFVFSCLICLTACERLGAVA
jgi:hypothetical protein